MMPYSTTTVLALLLDLIYVEANMSLVGSRPEHEGSVAIAGENKTCRSAVEATINCEMTADCQGMWFYESGTKKYCQAATCPSAPGKLNTVPGQAGFFFLFSGIFETGNLRRYSCR